MDFTSKVDIKETVFSQEVGEELVVLDLNSENYFGLDTVAGDMWKLLKDGKTLQETLDALLDMYDVQAEQLRADLESFVYRLIECNLAELSESK